MTPHEYSVIGHSRAKVGRYLGTVAGVVASACAVIAALALDLFRSIGLAGHLPDVVLLPFSAAVVYPLGHRLFDHWAWRRPWMLRLLAIPDLNGTWTCEGITLEADGGIRFAWTGTVTVTQTWEKIRVYLDTGSSRSASVSAALVKEPGRGFILMYSYRNEPKIGEKDLRSHIGYCELAFNESATAAEGDYFNNKGRVTYGRMKLSRKGS